jgi:hypothetical protein
MPDKPKSPSESLEHLLARAEHFANFALRKNGRLSPTLIVHEHYCCRAGNNGQTKHLAEVS